MTLPSRRPRPLYSAQPPGGQGGAQIQTQPQTGAPTGRRGQATEEKVLAELEEAARQGRPAPGYRALAALVGRDERPIRDALARLERQGRIRRIATRVGNRYEIPALGLITAPRPMAAPKPSRADRPHRPLTAWNHKRDNSLTEPQRQALSAARLEIAEHGAASIAGVAQRLGIGRSAARNRLVSVAARGHLAQRADACFILRAAAAPAPDDVRTEIRDGVQVTICPPRYADGALIFRSALGRGAGGRR